MTSILAAIIAMTMGGCTTVPQEQKWKGPKVAAEIRKVDKEKAYQELHKRARSFCEGEFTDLIQIEWCVSRYVQELSE